LGTTYNGSKYFNPKNGEYYGIIFSIDTNGGGYKVLLDFNGTNGGNPYGCELIHLRNKLFGTTSSGGKYNGGTIFSIDTSGSKFINLFNFGDSTGCSTNGAEPNGSLAFSGNKLYGMTACGGIGVGGTLFSIDTNGNGYRVLFNVTNGGDSYCSIVLSNSILYGVTQGGSLGYGYIFSVDTNGKNANEMFDFNNANGARPVLCGLTLWGGMIYGVTDNGGANNVGVIFSYKDTSVTTSVDKLIVNSEKLKVYPNPVNSVLTVEVKSEKLIVNSIVEIYNVLGEKVYAQNLKLAQGENSFTFDVSGFSSGVYLLQINTADGVGVASKKFVVK
jgi:uncharacterized repeat protein (TIGR03803 family)